MKKNNFASIESIISVAKKGGMFILVDDEKRDDLNKRKDELPSKSLETIGRVALAYKLNKK